MVQQGTDGLNNYGPRIERVIKRLVPSGKYDGERESYHLFKGNSGKHYLIKHAKGVFTKGGGRTEALALPFQIGDISGLDQDKLIMSFAKKIDLILNKAVKADGEGKYDIDEVSAKGEEIGSQLKEWWDNHVSEELGVKKEAKADTQSILDTIQNDYLQPLKPKLKKHFLKIE